MAPARLALAVCGLAGAAVLAVSTSTAGERTAVGVNVNVSKTRGPQSEASIAIHPLDSDILRRRTTCFHRGLADEDVSARIESLLATASTER